MAHVSTPFAGAVLNSPAAASYVLPADANLQGYSALSAALANGDTCYYMAKHVNKNEWEFGLGTYTASTKTLARTTVLRGSNGTSAVNFSGGAVEITMAIAGDVTPLSDWPLSNVGATRTFSGSEGTAANISAALSLLIQDLITAGVLK